MRPARSRRRVAASSAGNGFPASRSARTSANPRRLKVERIGNMNYQEAARQKKLYGSLLITVSIRSDGTLENVEINRSSGHRVLDAAAVRVVEMSAPYAAFPPDIRRDTDILHITRTWTFTKADELVSR